MAGGSQDCHRPSFTPKFNIISAIVATVQK